MANTPITGSWIKGWDQKMLLTCFDKVSTPLGLTDITKDATFNPDDIAQREISQRRGDNSMEFMNLWREPPNLNEALANSPVAMRAKGFGVCDPNDPSISGRAMAIPVILPYTVRVWSKSLEKICLVEEEWLLWKYRDPTLDIYASVLGNTIPLRGNLHFGKISDGSQVANKFADGRYYSVSLSVALHAYVFRFVEFPAITTITVRLFNSSDPQSEVQTELVREWEITAE